MNPQPRAEWYWAGLDADGAARLWRALSVWVRWLVERYDLAETLPGCWWRHPAFVEELTALYTSWMGAYADPQSTRDAPLVWHERFATTRARVAEWDRLGCARGHHRDAEPLAWDFDAPTFDAFVKADLLRRLGLHLVPSDDEDEQC